MEVMRIDKRQLEIDISNLIEKFCNKHGIPMKDLNVTHGYNPEYCNSDKIQWPENITTAISFNIS